MVKIKIECNLNCRGLLLSKW